PDHYSVVGPNTQTLCELAQTEPVAVESRVPTRAAMPRETRTRRLTRPAPGSTAGGAGTAPRPLASLLANGGKATDLLPHLHQHALDATGGICSLLFQQNPRNGILQATHAFGLDELRPDPWIPGADEAALVVAAFERRAPTMVADANRQMPDLS